MNQGLSSLRWSSVDLSDSHLESVARNVVLNDKILGFPKSL